MRLTTVLYQVNYHRHFQRIWKRQGKMEVESYEMSSEFQAMIKEKNIKIINAKDLLNGKVYKPKSEKSMDNTNRIAPSVFTEKAAYYRMHDAVRVTENENQILCLTKTIPYEGLPKQITSLIDIQRMPDQDELVQYRILESHVWDATQDKLPRRPKSATGYIFKREYGIPAEQKVSNLLLKLAFMACGYTGVYNDCLEMRLKWDAYAQVGVKRKENNIAFEMCSDIVQTYNKPLQRFASPDEVNATKEAVVPNIYPIKPILDLEKCETDPLKDQIELNWPALANRRIHSIFLTDPSHMPWHPREQLAKAIAACFTFTAEDARKRFGADVGILPEPVCVQCMYMDIKSANFIVYQLNTLELNNDDGIKNQVWIDEHADFFEEVSEVDLIKGYNPSIFPKMVAFFINGLHSTNS